MNQHRGDVAVGDEVFFFNSGAAAGIFVVGRVVSPVYDAHADEFGRWIASTSFSIDDSTLFLLLLARASVRRSTNSTKL